MAVVGKEYTVLTEFSKAGLRPKQFPDTEYGGDVIVVSFIHIFMDAAFIQTGAAATPATDSVTVKE